LGWDIKNLFIASCFLSKIITCFLSHEFSPFCGFFWEDSAFISIEKFIIIIIMIFIIIISDCVFWVLLVVYRRVAELVIILLPTYTLYSLSSSQILQHQPRNIIKSSSYILSSYGTLHGVWNKIARSAIIRILFD